MLRSFERKLEQHKLIHAPIKTIFYKKQVFLANRFLSKSTYYKNLVREHEFFKLNAELWAAYKKDFEKFHNELIKSSAAERKNWNLINEIRNSVKTTTTVQSRINFIIDIITEKTKIANLLNLKFSKL